MRVLCLVLCMVVACRAAPGAANEDEGKLELFSGVVIEKDASGEDKLNVKFEPGELREAARTFEEGNLVINKRYNSNAARHRSMTYYVENATSRAVKVTPAHPLQYSANEKARGKIKKYTPFLAGVGVKVIAVVALLFGGLTLLVTKALVVAKLAFLAAAALGVQKLLSGGGLNNISGKIANFQSTPTQWSSPTASASSYPYARSSSLAQDPNDLAYRAQITS